MKGHVIKVCKLLLFALIAFILIKLTTFGFTIASKSESGLRGQSKMTEKRLKEIVSYLSEDIGNRDFEDYENLNRAKDYIVRAFENLGYEVELMGYQVNTQPFYNIIAKSPGLDPSHEVIILGAHYDSCGNPGADDNASGVAGLLEIARLLKEEDLKTDVKFIAFVNEEPPFFKTEFMGSRVYTKKAKAQKEKIKAALIFEMIGYYREEKNSQRYPPFLGLFFPNEGNFIAIVTNFHSRKVSQRVVSYFKEGSDFPVVFASLPSFISGVDWSDHWSFWKEKYPAMMITDTAYLRNEHYHSNTDLPQTLDYGKMAKVVLGLKDALMKLANE